MAENHYIVYRVTRDRNSVFCVGMTADLMQRISNHKDAIVDGFTKKRDVEKLVCY